MFRDEASPSPDNVKTIRNQPENEISKSPTKVNKLIKPRTSPETKTNRISYNDELKDITSKLQTTQPHYKPGGGDVVVCNIFFEKKTNKRLVFRYLMNQFV